MLSSSKGQQDLNKVSADGIVVGTGEDDEANRGSTKSIRDIDAQRESIDGDDMEDVERRVEILRAMAEGEHNFFYFPYEAQQVLFLMVKGDNEGLAQSKLYCQDPEQFNYYFSSVVQFSQEFDPTDTLM